jgi:hypothetical protein
MDHSDEAIVNNSECFFELKSFDCDERLCPPSHWSCGDGQCTFSLLRFTYETYFPMVIWCLSFRDCNYACETCAEPNLWTVENGLCWDFFEQNTPELKLAMTLTDDICL